MKLMQILNEAGLSRLLSTIKNNDFAIISGYRSGNSPKLNKSLNGKLLQHLNRERLGGYVLIGHWQEAPDGVEWKDATPDQLTDTVEESILYVKPDTMSREEFISMGIDLAKRFNQDAVIMGLSTGKESSPNRSVVGGMVVYLYFKDGTREEIGTQLTLGKIGQAYSQMKNKSNVPFVFESIKK